MCFAGTNFIIKPTKYISQDAGIQDTIHTIKDVTYGNYHFWCVDKTNGEIIDITPPQAPPQNNNPQYFKWSKREQDNQKLYCIYAHNQEFDYKLNEELDRIHKEKDYKKGRCFINTYSVYHSDPDRYEIVCGSFGYIIKDTPQVRIIDLDYGY